MTKTYLSKMKKLFQELISANDGTSSKRVVSIIAFLNVLGMAWVSQFTEYKVDEYVFDGLLLLAGAGLGLTVIEKIFTKYNKTP